YEAVVHGVPVADADVAGGWSRIEAPLIIDWPNRPLQKVDADSGLPSLTRWRAMPSNAMTGTTRVELEPFTGRSHQLRVHLRHIGHPILGDVFYAPPAVQAMAPRLLLHAAHIAFAHPVTGEPMRFDSTPAF
ncbi:MAG: RNA pseudouridine synthase, partial [Variovorax sp.]